MSTACPGGKILLGVGGGIAAFRACELVRELVKGGHEVKVVMTDAARRFVQPLTFETLTGHRVPEGIFGEDAHQMPHIELARWCDLLVVAPASAHLIARLANGLASDLLATLYLVYQGTTLLAPAMNPSMYKHPAVERNLSLLTSHGVLITGPREGEAACGETGEGPMVLPADLLSRIEENLSLRTDLRGRQILITAGPTAEYLDPVRFLSNRSSGKMGTALAREAALRGARVTLVHGPVTISGVPMSVQCVPVTSNAEMAEAVSARFEETDVLIAAAAVSDYKPVLVSARKLKKNGERGDIRVLEVERTADILATLGQRRRDDQVLVGFAAETEDLEERARCKLEKKNLDMIVANRIEEDGFPFGADENRVVLLARGGDPVRLEPLSKAQVARRILDEVADRLASTSAPMAE